jgi:hypothetical protein
MLRLWQLSVHVTVAFSTLVHIQATGCAAANHGTEGGAAGVFKPFTKEIIYRTLHDTDA